MIKIPIPHETVCIAVQKKALEHGFRWKNSGKVVLENKSMLMILIDGNTLTYRTADSNVAVPNVDRVVSWQEFLYGEGYFFRSSSNSTGIIYFQAKEDGRVYYNYGGSIERAPATTYGAYRDNGAWKIVDYNGNPINEPNDECKFKEVI